MPDDLYNTDYVAWAAEQAEQLRRAKAAGSNLPLDWDNLVEEVEDLANVPRDQLRSALVRVIEHLLKLEWSPATHPRRSWRVSLTEHRVRAAGLLEESGTLRSELPRHIGKAWRDGRRIAATALQQFDSVDPVKLPTDCPYTVEQLIDTDWYPPSRQGLD